MDILIQAVGGIAILVWIYSITKPNKKEIMTFQALANLFYGIQYILLNIYTAGFLNFSSVIRCLLFRNKQSKQTSFAIFLTFSALAIIIAFFTYDGPLSLIPIIITLFYIFSSWRENLTVFRSVYIFCAAVWLSYNFIVGAYVICIGNLLELSIGIKSLVKYEGEGKNNGK